MNKLFVSVLVFVAFFLGVVASSFMIGNMGKNMMILEHKSPYDYSKTVETITNRINAKSGWKVISVINQGEEIKNGGGADCGKITIIKYCSSKFAGEMLSYDDRKKMAVAMPISIAVYEKSTGECMVSVNNGYLTSKLYGGEVEKIIELVSYDVEEILSFMSFKFTRF